MHNLYCKSELWFSILWIVIYVFGTSIADNIHKAVTLILHIILCALLLAWIKKHGLFAKYGLCKGRFPASKFLYYLPLLIIMSCNLWFGLMLNMPLSESLCYAASMLCVGFLEELIFRGFLFKAMSKDGLTSAIIVSSITFGLGHIVNLFNGSGAELIPNLCQVCYATAAGFLFVLIFHRGGSLHPCIITHSVVNALSVFSFRPSSELCILTAVILTVVSVLYALYLVKVLPKPAVDKPTEQC